MSLLELRLLIYSTVCINLTEHSEDILHIQHKASDDRFLAATILHYLTAGKKYVLLEN